MAKNVKRKKDATKTVQAVSDKATSLLPVLMCFWTTTELYETKAKRLNPSRQTLRLSRGKNVDDFGWTSNKNNSRHCWCKWLGVLLAIKQVGSLTSNLTSLRLH